MNYKIVVTLRSDKKDAKENYPIYLYVYEGAKRTNRISIGHKTTLKNWDEEARRMKDKAPNSTLINSIINKKVSDLEKAFLKEEALTGEVNPAQYFKKEKAKETDFFEYAAKQIKEKDYRPETRRAYSVFVEKVRAFKSSLKLSQIDYEFLQSYEAYLRDTLKNSRNTVWGNFKFLKTMANDALKMGLLDIDPFIKYKRVTYKQTEPTFLTGPEVEKIEDFAANCLNEGLKAVAYHFLFMCYTGLRFSDGVRFRSEDINEERITMKTQKTGAITNLFVNDRIKGILKHLTANPLNISQTDYNRKLKLVAEVCGIKKRLSSHVARHSFGSSLVDLNIPLEVAKGLLTHSSTASTKIYYHLKNSNLDEAMKKFNK